MVGLGIGDKCERVSMSKYSVSDVMGITVVIIIAGLILFGISSAYSNGDNTNSDEQSGYECEDDEWSKYGRSRGQCSREYDGYDPKYFDEMEKAQEEEMESRASEAQLDMLQEQMDNDEGYQE